METTHANSVAQNSPKTFQWLPALKAGFIAGLVLMFVPRASIWSSLNFFAPVIMGRVVPETWAMPVVIVKTLHIAISIVFGFVIAIAVSRITQLRAVLAGAGVGLLLYFGGLGIVSRWFPELHGDEITVAFAHAVFGGIAGGAYRGLLWRNAEPQTEES